MTVTTDKPKRPRPSNRHPSQGPGWGGPAKPPLKPHPPFEKGNKMRLRVPDMRKVEYREQVAEEMRGILYGLAKTAEREDNRIRASAELLNRIEGLPVARVVQHNTGEMVQRVISGTPLSVDEWAERYAAKDDTGSNGKTIEGDKPDDVET